MDLSQEPDRLTLPVGDRDHCQGSPTAEMTVVQYGDYQCPACQAVQHLVQTVQQRWGDRLQFVFRHFPQAQIHPEAHHAAEAAEAAASQNKFWEMHTILLEHPSQLTDSHLVEYAIAIFLDVNQFLEEMTMDCHLPKIQADIESGIKSGVTKTPTFFINGVKSNDNQSLEILLTKATNANSE